MSDIDYIILKGGPADGSHRWIPAGMPEWKVATRFSPPASWHTDGPQILNKQVTAIYRRGEVTIYGVEYHHVE